MIQRANQYYEFGPYRVDAQERQLLRDGEVVPLTPKVFDTLLAFVENPGHILTKDELMKTIWPDRVVEENNLTRNISTLRKALGESSDEHQYIETIPWRGYRFVASVKEEWDDGLEVVVQQRQTMPEIISEKEERIERQGEDKVSSYASRKRKPRLEVLAIPVILAALTAAALYLWLTNKPKLVAGPSIKSIAVLPFKPLVADRRDEAIEIGMAATLINRLSSTGQIIVPSIRTVSKYTSLEQDPIAAGRELKVDAVLEGSILWEGNKIRVMGRLLRVADGATLWADKCDQQCTNIFEVQDLISEEIVKALGKHLTDEQQRLLVKRGTQNPEAYRLYLLGEYHLFKRTVAEAEKAVKYFEQAIALDPDYAQAWYGLAFSYGSVGDLGGVPPKDIMSKVKSTLSRALELDDQLAEAHALRGFHLMTYDWNWSEARREYERAIELNPTSAYCRLEYGLYLICVGRFDEAIKEMQTAVEFDPASPFHNRNLGFTFYYAREFDRAIEQLLRTLDLDPNYLTVYEWLGNSYLEKGDYDQAVEAYLKGDLISGSDSAAIRAMKEAYETKGWRGYLQKRLELTKDWEKQRYVPPEVFAGLYAQLGEKERALEMLEKACEERQYSVTAINVTPKWDSLRSDPRFTDLLRRVGLEP